MKREGFVSAHKSRESSVYHGRGDMTAGAALPLALKAYISCSHHGQPGNTAQARTRAGYNVQRLLVTSATQAPRAK